MKKLVLIIVVAVNIFAGCGNHPHQNQPNTRPHLLSLPMSKPAKGAISPTQFLVSSDNKWTDSSSWGSPGAIDIAETRTLAEDPRVHQIFKDQLPILCEEFVLWRVTHDGSCWIDVGVILTLSHLIMNSDDKFDEAIVVFKEMFAIKNEIFPAEDQELSKGFFDALKLLRAKKMDFHYCFHFISHRNVRDVFMKGFRKLLSNCFYLEKDMALAMRFARLGDWGDAYHFSPVFERLGIKYADISNNGALRPEYIEPTQVLLSEHLSSRKDIFGADPSIRKIIREQLPDIISFNTSPGYGDIIVKKSFADSLKF